MLRSRVALFGLAGLLCSASTTPAQVFIKAPFVRVQTGGPGGGVFVKAPFVTVNVPPRYPVYYGPAPTYTVPVAVEPLLPELPAPKPFIPPVNDETIVIPPQTQVNVPTVPVGKRAVMTHEQFAKNFVPFPGKHDVTLIHPKSGQPLDISFTLPPGTPKVLTGPRNVIFDYGTSEVEIRFALFGKVKVFYN